MKKTIFLLSILLILISCTTVLGNFKKKEVKIYYEEIQILNGDTLYSIANKYKTDTMDLNDYIDEIKNLNCIQKDKIYFGKKIIVPVHIIEI